MSWNTTVPVLIVGAGPGRTRDRPRARAPRHRSLLVERRPSRRKLPRATADQHPLHGADPHVGAGGGGARGRRSTRAGRCWIASARPAPTRVPRSRSVCRTREHTAPAQPRRGGVRAARSPRGRALDHLRAQAGRAEFATQISAWTNVARRRRVTFGGMGAATSMSSSAATSSRPTARTARPSARSSIPDATVPITLARASPCSSAHRSGTCRRHRYGIYASATRASGTLPARRPDDRWLYGVHWEPGERPLDDSRRNASELIRLAAGVPDSAADRADRRLLVRRPRWPTLPRTGACSSSATPPTASPRAAAPA